MKLSHSTQEGTHHGMDWRGYGALLECPIYDIHFQTSLLTSFIYWSSGVIYCLLSVCVAVCDSYDRVGAKGHIGRPMLTFSVIPWFIWSFWPLFRQVVQLCNIWPPGQKNTKKTSATKGVLPWQSRFTFVTFKQLTFPLNCHYWSNFALVSLHI